MLVSKGQDSPQGLETCFVYLKIRRRGKLKGGFYGQFLDLKDNTFTYSNHKILLCIK